MLAYTTIWRLEYTGLMSLGYSGDNGWAMYVYTFQLAYGMSEFMFELIHIPNSWCLVLCDFQTNRPL